MTARNLATERQVQAAQPNVSTWLAANAGSGKTRVLTDRVARLLLEGVEPQRILCLTYTKAAASEMQNRLFARLGAWAMRDDTALRVSLEELGVDGPLAADDLARARTLFARAIETPGGLKIQTIHSFCASLLRRFPLEAGVSPQFAEMEDRAAALLRNEIVEDMAGGLAVDVVDAVAPYLTDGGLEAFCAAVAHQRHAFATPMQRAEIDDLFDVPPGLTLPRLIDETCQASDIALIQSLIAPLRTGGVSDAKAADRLNRVTDATTDALDIMEAVFLTGAGAKTKAPFTAKIGSFPTKALREGALSADMPALEDLMRRVEAARATRIALEAAEKTHALHRFAAVFLPEYERRKQARGWLDFDDLILKARELLTNPALAAWVLFRLDGGIDHILVDEAQDTSPAQWDVIEKLAQEFTSGLGARTDTQRTIFVVGDKKQSIYSFQGADPDAFDRMQAEFGHRLQATGQGLQDLTLEFSFRSSPAILALVDLVFEGSAAAGFSRESLHRAFKSELPGRVDLWPVEPAGDDQEDRPWYDPVDRRSPQHHTVRLADRIASQIREMISRGETIPDDGPKPGSFVRRPVHAGDFLILVQKRSVLFAEIIRACKAAGLPIAGADVIKVGAELAVRDLAALLRFLETPEDNLSLACALKSPLFGWTEQALFDLAHRRDGPFLWRALVDRSEAFAETVATLTDLMAQTDFLRPYDLIERVLTRHNGRRNLLARLGPEAEDGINALLGQALAYERSEIPSLTGFLRWMETDDLEVKRQMGSAAGMIRVMTVHGAKGLESPIVILPDTGKRQPPKDSEIFVDGGTPLWRTNKDATPDRIQRARMAARDNQMNERLRLLYVALTRAEKWLIVTAAGDLDKNGDSWYQRIEAGLEKAGAEACDFAGGSGLRLSYGDWAGLEQRDTPPVQRPDVTLPAFARTPAPAPTHEAETISPSDLGGAKALPGEAGLDEAAALERGTRLHRLLEHLPSLSPDAWETAASDLLPDLSAAARQDLLDEAKAVLTTPALSHLFDPAALAEVAITATIGGHRLHGAIDRLIVGDGRVLAVDFKTNAVVPSGPDDTPEGLLRQMGAYALALEAIYPEHRIETAILWTRVARLMVLPHDLVTAAFWRSPRLDDGERRS